MQFVVHPLLRAEADQFTNDTVELFINNAAYIGGGQMFLGTATVRASLISRALSTWSRTNGRTV